MRSIMSDYAASYAILEALTHFLQNMRSFGIKYFRPF